MTMSAEKVDLLVQYALLIAGREDDLTDRSLGPIHLLKYVYLGDLFFAERNDGQTFTGVDWVFYHFGPWSPAVHDRIPLAAKAIHADHFVGESDYEGRNDWHRWTCRGEAKLRVIESKLPTLIQTRLSPIVHKYLKDTPSLLDFVYKTQPMLEAAPNAPLNFRSRQVVGTPMVGTPMVEQATQYDQLSNRKKRKLRERMEALREKVKANPPERRKLVAPACAPRYDDVYFKGIEWLDGLAGDPLEPGTYLVEFSDEVWNSDLRQRR